MQTTDIIAAIREDIKRGLRDEILAELEPEINRRLYANVFTFAEAMAYLKVSEPTLRRMVRDGEIPNFKQRGNLYFRQIDLDKHIDQLVRKGVTA